MNDDETKAVRSALQFLAALNLQDHPVAEQRCYLEITRGLNALVRRPAAEREHFRIDYQELEKKALRQMAKVARFTDAAGAFDCGPEVLRGLRAKFPEIDAYLDSMPKFDAEVVTGRQWSDHKLPPPVRGFCRFEMDAPPERFSISLQTRIFKPSTWFGSGDTPRSAFDVEHFLIGNREYPFVLRPGKEYPIVDADLSVTLHVRLNAKVSKFQLTLWGKTVSEDSDPIGDTAIDVRKK